MFLNLKKQLEKVQLTRDLKDDTILYHQGLRLPCKNDQGYRDSTTKTQATIVWFPDDTCTTIHVAKILERKINIQQITFKSLYLSMKSTLSELDQTHRSIKIKLEYR